MGTVCVVALQDLDSNLFLRLKVILSMDSPIADSLVQVAASKAVTVLVRQYVPLFSRSLENSTTYRSFPETASSLVSHLRRFVTSPVATFENEFVSESRIPPPVYAAAKCLALCIQVSDTCLLFIVCSSMIVGTG
jgi:phosphatidylinositol 4-kinase